MSWITDDWRLKLLALLLAVLLLAAVAFSQNPSTARTFHPAVNYTLPPTLIVLNPQLSVATTVSGLSDTLAQMSDNSLTASVDASNAAPGPAVKLTIQIRSLVGGVNVQNPSVPIALNIDTRAVEELKVQVITHPVAGWSVTGAHALCGSTSDCLVHFDGPLSWEKAANLSATVNFTVPIQASTNNSGNWPIALRNSNGPVDPLSCKTAPPCGLDITTVSISVTAQAGTTSTTVALVDDTPSQPPPAGYHLTAVTVSPLTVIVTGDPGALVKLQRIILPKVDLTNAPWVPTPGPGVTTSTAQIKVNINYPNGITPVNGIVTATITYTIVQNPSVSPSPSP